MTTFSAEDFSQQMARVGQDVSRETLARLGHFVDFLGKWQRAINLVSNESFKDPWRRHILDSAQLAPYLPPAGGDITDLGSGAGFPGLVLAMLTGWNVRLIDSDQRKCVFLREAARHCGVYDRVQVYDRRFEEITPWPAPVITARACAPLAQLLRHAEPFLTPGTLCLFLKGARVEEELTEAAMIWKMRAGRFPSLTDSQGVILKLTEIERQSESKDENAREPKP